MAEECPAVQWNLLEHPDLDEPVQKSSFRSHPAAEVSSIQMFQLFRPLESGYPNFLKIVVSLTKIKLQSDLLAHRSI